MYILKDKWANFSWNWIWASPYLFGHLSVSCFINIAYLHEVLTCIFIKYILLTVQTVDKWEWESALPPDTGRFFTTLSRKIFCSISFLFTCSFIDWQHGQNWNNNTLINLVCIYWAITVCSASFSVICRYGLSSYRVPLHEISFIEVTLFMYIKGRKMCHSFIHPVIQEICV